MSETEQNRPTTIWDAVLTCLVVAAIAVYVAVKFLFACVMVLLKLSWLVLPFVVACAVLTAVLTAYFLGGAIAAATSRARLSQLARLEWTDTGIAWRVDPTQVQVDVDIQGHVRGCTLAAVVMVSAVLWLSCGNDRLGPGHLVFNAWGIMPGGGPVDVVTAVTWAPLGNPWPVNRELLVFVGWVVALTGIQVLCWPLPAVYERRMKGALANFRGDVTVSDVALVKLRQLEDVSDRAAASLRVPYSPGIREKVETQLRSVLARGTPHTGDVVPRVWAELQRVERDLIRFARGREIVRPVEEEHERLLARAQQLPVAILQELLRLDIDTGLAKAKALLAEGDETGFLAAVDAQRQALEKFRTWALSRPPPSSPTRGGRSQPPKPYVSISDQHGAIVNRTS